MLAIPAKVGEAGHRLLRLPSSLSTDAPGMLEGALADMERKAREAPGKKKKGPKLTDVKKRLKRKLGKKKRKAVPATEKAPEEAPEENPPSQNAIRKRGGRLQKINVPEEELAKTPHGRKILLTRCCQARKNKRCPKEVMVSWSCLSWFVKNRNLASSNLVSS
jgi:hypothetical protein